MSRRKKEAFKKSGIKSWSEDDRPREKLVSKGENSLSDAELIAILIGSGTPVRNALDLARDVLKLVDRKLGTLGKVTITELTQIKGIGPAKAITLLAAIELGRRRQMEPAIAREIITGYQDAVDILQPLLQDLGQEVFCVLYMDISGALIRHEFISYGGLTATIADIRIILKNALLYKSSRIIVAHNHPSGNPKVSEADKKLTYKLQSAAGSMDIELLDHIIIAGKQAVSFANEGLL
ncbi:RadC family protein [Rurimicrobium arvi]|uniref:DNA repair protein RadC n=1 Tax=Rurimicrobium arvi TaxID=2049916 RepID=A0ABP8MWH5_9BACT